jgi:hypothetical protein
LRTRIELLERLIEAYQNNEHTSSMDSSWPAERCLEAEVPHASKTNFEMTGGDFRFQ